VGVGVGEKGGVGWVWGGGVGGVVKVGVWGCGGGGEGVADSG